MPSFDLQADERLGQRFMAIALDSAAIGRGTAGTDAADPARRKMSGLAHPLGFGSGFDSRHDDPRGAGVQRGCDFCRLMARDADKARETSK